MLRLHSQPHRTRVNEHDLYEIARAINRAFYYRHDGGGRWWWVQHVYPSAEGDAFAGSCIAYAEHEDRWYRALYTFDPAAERSDDEPDFASQVSFTDEAEWTEVQHAWLPVMTASSEERAGYDARKLSFFTLAGTAAETRGMGATNAPSMTTRSLECEVRYMPEERSTTVIVTTGAVDNHRTIFDPNGADWSDFAGRFFINHDYGLLAGRADAPVRQGDAWVATIDDDAWDHDDPEVERWFRKVKSGLCDRVSLGAMPVEGQWEDADDGSGRVYRFTKWRGMEWSFVGLGSNLDAVVTQRSNEPAPAERAASPATATAPRAAAPTDAAPAAPQPQLRHFTPEQLRALRTERQRRLQDLANQRLGRA